MVPCFGLIAVADASFMILDAEYATGQVLDVVLKDGQAKYTGLSTLPGATVASTRKAALTNKVLDAIARTSTNKRKLKPAQSSTADEAGCCV